MLYISYSNRKGNDRLIVGLLHALSNTLSMLTYDQLQEIRDAAQHTAHLLNVHFNAGNSLLEHLRLVLSLTKDPDSLDVKTRALLDELIVQVYPSMDWNAFKQPSIEVIEDEPEHVTTQWVIDYLDVSKSTFYSHVFKKLLFPIERIGNRSYYLKAEVLDLMVRHEKGAWTFSKLAKKGANKGMVCRVR